MCSRTTRSSTLCFTAERGDRVLQQTAVEDPHVRCGGCRSTELLPSPQCQSSRRSRLRAARRCRVPPARGVWLRPPNPRLAVSVGDQDPALLRHGDAGHRDGVGGMTATHRREPGLRHPCHGLEVRRVVEIALENHAVGDTANGEQVTEVSGQRRPPRPGDALDDDETRLDYCSSSVLVFRLARRAVGRVPGLGLGAAAGQRALIGSRAAERGRRGPRG